MIPLSLRRPILPFLAALILAGSMSHPVGGAEAVSFVPNGGFETDADGDKWPDGWGRPKGGGSWQEEGGNHFLRLTSGTPGEMVMLYQQIRIPETVKAIEMTFRMRVSDLKKGKQAWFDARIMMDFKDAAGTKLKGAPAPNTGKTLIIIHLVLRAIAEGKIDPDCVIYVNADDTSSGLAVKGRLFQDAGAHMMAPGHKGMKIRHLVEKLVQAVEDGSARGRLVIIDTLKKFTDLMDKKRTSEFGQVCREYVMAGGTIVALGHTRKSPKADGSPQYQGTTDILEDFDGVYVAELMTDSGRKDRRVVQFNMEKKRADSPNVVAYAYADELGISYDEKLASVEPVDPEDFTPDRKGDYGVDIVKVTVTIAGIIGDGFAGGKGALADATAAACGISKRKAIRIIEEKTGSTSGVHIWNTRTGEHNTQIYRLLIDD